MPASTLSFAWKIAMLSIRGPLAFVVGVLFAVGSHVVPGLERVVSAELIATVGLWFVIQSVGPLFSLIYHVSQVGREVLKLRQLKHRKLCTLKWWRGQLLPLLAWLLLAAALASARVADESSFFMLLALFLATAAGALQSVQSLQTLKTLKQVYARTNCLKCGYEARDLVRCPECGAQRKSG